MNSESHDRPLTPAERRLRLFLRAVGAVMMLALVAAVMPGEWMARAHEALGLGAFPEAPIVRYLARSLSAAYALAGALCGMFAADVRRYDALIAFVAYATIATGVLLQVTDLALELPAWWKYGEGPADVALGVVTLVLLNRARIERVK